MGVTDNGGSSRVIRGGSWANNTRNLRCANRNRRHPGNRNQNQGFRVVCRVAAEHVLMTKPMRNVQVTRGPCGLTRPAPTSSFGDRRRGPPPFDLGSDA